MRLIGYEDMRLIGKLCETGKEDSAQASLGISEILH